MAVWDFFHQFKTKWHWVAPILAIDAIGMAFGWYYYWDVGQFDPSSRYYEHWAWWPLVADSPNAVLLFFLSLLIYKTTGKRYRALDWSAFILNVYVGLWTTYLFLAYPERMGTWEWGGTNNILFFSHMGMPLQAMVLVRDLRKDVRPPLVAAGAVVAAAAIYIGVDYWGPHIHPAPFLHDGSGDAVLHAGSPWLMVVAVAAWAVVVFTTRARPRTTPL